MKRVLALLVVASCGAAATPLAQPVAKKTRVDLDRFLADEESALVVLAAADPRIAARGIAVDPATVHHTAMNAILAEDPTLGMEGNRPDVLSFDARARALDKATAIVSAWKVAPTDPDPESALRPEIELELLTRFVASERLRLAWERDLPHGASTLFSALAATWQTPQVKEVSTRDNWLSARFDEISGTLKPQSLTLLERDELDDALDPLERVMADALPKSRQALVRLRLAVQNVETAPRAPDRWETVSARLRAASGNTLSADTLVAFFGTEAKLLKGEMDQLVVKPTEESAARAADAVFAAPEPCHTKPLSRLRGLDPPPERAEGCALRRRLIAAHTADDYLALLMEMHDVVMGAAWAVILARGGDAATMAMAAPRPVMPLAPTAEGKLTRLAAVAPVELISRALAIEWLLRKGLADAGLRSQTWQTFGDAPLDIIERELHPEHHVGEPTAKTKGWK